MPAVGEDCKLTRSYLLGVLDHASIAARIRAPRNRGRVAEDDRRPSSSKSSLVSGRPALRATRSLGRRAHARVAVKVMSIGRARAPPGPLLDERARSRSAPRVWIPTSATVSEVVLRSIISCAMRIASCDTIPRPQDCCDRERRVRHSPRFPALWTVRGGRSLVTVPAGRSLLLRWDPELLPPRRGLIVDVFDGLGKMMRGGEDAEVLPRDWRTGLVMRPKGS